MEGLTLTVAAIASTLVCFLAPIYGFVVYLAALAWYPSYLTIPVGTIDFTARRIVILAIFAKLFLQTDLPGRFKFMWLDKLVIIYFAAQILAGATTTTSLMAFLENRAGAVFDMVLPYFAVRMIVISTKEYSTLLKSILIIAAPLAIIGFYQSLTGNNPVGFFEKYYAWGTGRDYAPIARSGFFRANVVFPHSIMYGLFFAILGPVCAGILHSTKKYKVLYWAGLGLMGVGIFSCMSGGPILAAMLAVGFIAFYRYRRHWKLAAAVIILMVGAVEIISNRHFYDVLGGFTFNPRTAWHRTRIMEVALFEGGMSGRWLTGFGDADPGWGANIYGGETHTDITNHYLLILSRFGLLGLVPFLAIIVTAGRSLFNAFKLSTPDSDKWFIWCLSGAIFGLLGAMFSVSLFGQPTTVFYIMLAGAAVTPVIVTIEKDRLVANQV